MKTLRFILSATVSVIIIACGGGNKAKQDPDPSEVAEKYTAAMMNYDFDEVKKYLVKETLPLYEELVSSFLSDKQTVDVDNIIKPIMKHAKYKTVKKELSDDKQTAEVTVEITDRTSTFNDKSFSMVLEDGVWKIHHPIQIPSVTMDYSIKRGLYIDEKGKYKQAETSTE
jgi:hypothetical protein